MPKPPNDKRVSFPFRGVSDRVAYIDTPGDLAPVGSIINVRPLDPIGGRERGGKRPALREVRDAAGQPWGRVGTGPIQRICEIPRAAQVSGYVLGTGAATHQGWESRATAALSDNLYILRNKDSALQLSRSHALGTGFDDATDRDLNALCWTGAAALAGCVNEDPPATDLDNLLFKAAFTNGAANNGFGSPGWSAMDNWDTGGAAYSTNGGPWPSEQVACFYGDATLGGTLFLASSVTAGNPVGEPLSKGFLVAYTLSGTGVAAVAVGKTARLRLFGKVYHEATPGTPSTLTAGSVLVNAGAREIPCIVGREVGGVKAVYFAYDAARRGEAMVGRVDVGSLATTGLDLTLATSGAFQTNGSAFAVRAADFTVPVSALDPHYLSVNYPRGAKPTAVDVGPDGSVYYACSSAGEGVFSDPAAANYRPDHHPDYPGHRPVTVCKVDPAGIRFEWEAATNHDAGEDGYTRIGDPELIWLKADRGGDTDQGGCYAGGRTIGDANVFAINENDGGVRWRWRSGAAGGTSRTYAAAIDPDDGHLWVVGDRSNTWQGVSGGEYANVWKLSAESGAVLQKFDIGPGTNALSIDINPENGLIAVGTLCPGT